ncbi:unnamed protein product, partial [marine sediment metagenome]
MTENFLNLRIYQDLKNYEFPDPYDISRKRGLKEEIKKIKEKADKAIIIFNYTWGLWESLWLFRGFEQAYIDIASNMKFVEYFWEKLLWWMK